MAPKTTLDELPPAPKSDHCQNAWRVLKYAHDTAHSFLDMFNEKRGRGQPKVLHQDLLRAILVFASAGLDSMVKHLVKDALPAAIRKNDAIRDNFLEKFVERKIKQGEQPNYAVMVDVLVAKNSMDRMIAIGIKDLTAKSLQSVDELFRIASYFDIESEIFSENPEELKKIFHIRNNIIHEMDIDFDQNRRNRTPRQRDEMIKATNRLFNVCKVFLKAVDDKLK